MLQFDSVSVRFGEHHVQAVDDVTFTVSDGERCVVVGETGSGKSVLLLSVLGLLPETAKISGKIILENQELLTMDEHELQRLRGRIIGYVPQGGGNSLNPLMRIGEQVSEPLVVHNEIKKPIAWQRAIQLLEQLHMERPERALCRYDSTLVHTFAQQTQTCVVGEIAHDPAIARAEIMAATVIQHSPQSLAAQNFKVLAQMLERENTQKKFHSLSEAEMELFCRSSIEEMMQCP